MNALAISEPVDPGPLRPRDAQFLERAGYRYCATVENGMTLLVIQAFALPDGLQPRVVDLLLQLPAGFPDVSPDMYWCSPAVTRGDAGIPGVDSGTPYQYIGRNWQRWSRHYDGLWRPGIDDLGSLVAIVRRCLADAAGTTP
ncbi:MAG: E2/UBC family protein [Acidimicrobiales bacterium]